VSCGISFCSDIHKTKGHVSELQGRNWTLPVSSCFIYTHSTPSTTSTSVTWKLQHFAICDEWPYFLSYDPSGNQRWRSLLRRAQCRADSHLNQHGNINWMYSFKYNHQDATLYNILYYCQCSTCFRRFLRPSWGAQKLYTQHRVYVKLACCYR
jgi:hypothetical protein